MTRKTATRAMKGTSRHHAEFARVRRKRAQSFKPRKQGGQAIKRSGNVTYVV